MKSNTKSVNKFLKDKNQAKPQHTPTPKLQKVTSKMVGESMQDAHLKLEIKYRQLKESHAELLELVRAYRGWVSDSRIKEMGR